MPPDLSRSHAKDSELLVLPQRCCCACRWVSALFAVPSRSVSLEKARSKQHEPMPYYSVPTTVLAKTSSLRKWARTAIDIAHAPGAKRTTKKK